MLHFCFVKTPSLLKKEGPSVLCMSKYECFVFVYPSISDGLHITLYSRHLEEDECGWGAAGIHKRYLKPLGQ